MTVTKVGSKWGVFEGGEQVYEYKTKAAAEGWARLTERQRSDLRAIYARRQQAKATGMPMRGRVQRLYAYTQAAMDAGKV